MSSFYQTVISIISKPSEKRNEDEINFILNWFINLFKKKPAVFGDVTAEVIKDIIKNCSFETKNRDEIIIKQGDVGDCFYINLRGKVSIFINHNNHDETDHLDEIKQNKNNQKGDVIQSSSKGADENLNEFIETLTMTNEMKSKRLRENLGNYVTSLGVGEGFGEYALINSESRSASIIADEITDLMVVNKQLYSRCLQASTLRKLAEKQKFINNSPFFGNWSPKMKKLLSLCLERDFVPYDSYLGKQGEPLDKLYFIISGQAKVTVNSMMHKLQYPKLYPLKLAENQEQDLINSWKEEKNQVLNSQKAKNQLSESTLNQNNSKNIKKILIKRRNETFAEAEQRLKTKNIEVGILGPGEITGMCEAIFNMNSYMQTTKCIEDCDVYYIYKRSYDRLIAKRNPSCIKRMRDNVYMKLKARNQRLNKSSTPVDLFRSIQYGIELIKNKRNNFQNSNIEDDAEIISNDDETTNEIKNDKTYKSAPRGSIVQLDLRNKSSAYLRLKNLLDARKRKQFEIERKLLVLNNLTQSSDDNKEGSNEKINIDNNKTEDTTITSILKNNEIMNNDSNNLALISLEDRIKQFHLDLGCKRVSVTKLNRIDINKVKTEIKTGENVFVKKSSNFKSFNGNNGSNSSNSQNSSDINLSDDEYNMVPSLNYSRPVTNGGLYFKSNLNSIPNSQQLIQFDYNFIMSIIPPLNFNTDHNSKNITYLDNNEINNCETISNDYNDNKIIPIHSLNSCNNNQTTIDALYLNETKNSENHYKTVLNSSFQIEPLKQKNSEINSNNIDNNKEEIPKRIKKNSMPDLTHNIRRQSTSSNNNNNDPFSSYVVGRKFSLGQIKVQRTGKVYSKEEYIALKDILKKQTKRFNANPIKI